MKCPICGADESMSARVFSATAIPESSAGRRYRRVVIPELLLTDTVSARPGILGDDTGGAIVVCLRCSHPLRVGPGDELVVMSRDDLENLSDAEKQVLDQVLVSIARMHGTVGDPDA